MTQATLTRPPSKIHNPICNPNLHESVQTLVTTPETLILNIIGAKTLSRQIFLYTLNHFKRTPSRVLEPLHLSGNPLNLLKQNPAKFRTKTLVIASEGETFSTFEQADFVLWLNQLDSKAILVSNTPLITPDEMTRSLKLC
jgi:hypothetical protein